MLPVSVLLYALIDSPMPNIKYWKYLMYYMFFTLTLKFLYQLPMFCSSPAFHFYTNEGCDNNEVPADILLTRLDFIIGITKFSGPASYPAN